MQSDSDWLPVWWNISVLMRKVSSSSTMAPFTGHQRTLSGLLSMKLISIICYGLYTHQITTFSVSSFTLLLYFYFRNAILGRGKKVVPSEKNIWQSMPSGPKFKLPLLQWGNQLGRSNDRPPLPWWPSSGNVYPDCFVSFGLCSVCGHLALFGKTLTVALCVLDSMLASFVRPDSFSDTALMGFLFVALTLLCHVPWAFDLGDVALARKCGSKLDFILQKEIDLVFYIHALGERNILELVFVSALSERQTFLSCTDLCFFWGCFSLETTSCVSCL